jgi:quercetin dioxygenase-like cupin family protein
MSTEAAFIRTPGSSERLWSLGELMTIKVSGEDCGNSFALVEQLAPGSLATPLHAQLAADETFHVLEGEISVMLDGRERTAGPGDVVYVPRGAPHAARVVSEQARVLSIHAPAGHERFFRDAGQPAPSATLPPNDTPPDLERMAAAAAAHQVQILGPPPWSKAAGSDQTV